MRRVFPTHPPEALESYFGAKALAALKAIAEVALNPHDRELSVGELAEHARNSDIIISYRQTPGAPELLDMLPRLVAFSRCAVDIRNIDVAAASTRGILVTQASGDFVNAVSEWTIGAMIDLSRNMAVSTVAYHAGHVAAATMGRELRGSTLGVIGYGRISRALCKLAAAFGMRILVADPYAQEGGAAIEHVDLRQLLAESDYVVCLAIANEETENLMNEACFNALKPGAFFINPSRGDLVDESALMRALDDGRLAGFAMDVGRAPDQMPSPALARHPKVIATPHIGGLTPAAIEPKALETVAQAADILQGRLPAGAVNPAQATRLARFRQP